jgi:hypothetical protein
MNFPDLSIIKKEADNELNDAERVKALIERRTIQHNGGLRNSVQWLAEIKTQIAAIREQQKVFVNPLKEVIKRINNFFEPALGLLELSEELLKGKIVTYTVGQALMRSDLLEQVKSADPKKRDMLIKQSETYAPVKVPGLSMREAWTGEFIDEKNVIDWAIKTNSTSFLQINKRELEKYTKALGRDPQIPGWKASKKTTVVITASKV